jgi:hypothetical protein
MHRIAAFALVMALGSTAAHAQQCRTGPGSLEDPLADVNSERARLAEITDPVPALAARRRSDPFTTCNQPALRLKPLVARPGAPEYGLIPLRTDVVFNSGYDFGRNDGALWSGKGLSTAATGGVLVRWRGVSAALAPELTWSQNAEYPLVDVTWDDRSAFAYPWNRLIDLPQRMGEEAFGRVSLGQSYLRADGLGVSIGLSGENVWWGPGQRNSILLGTAAPGFGHVFLQMTRPRDIRIGTLEAGGIWARLEESAYFDTTVDNQHRLLTAARLAFRPYLFPGLTLGAERAYMTAWPADGISSGDLLPFFESPLKSQLGTPENPGGDDEANQILSLFARWVRPGFEAYVEWSRDDHSWDLWDFISQPDHTQGWTAGFAAAENVGGGRLRLAGEATHLGQSRTVERRSQGATWYTHGVIRHGYTHQGQILGAWIGPGSDAQWLALDWFSRTSRWGGYIERVRRNEDAFIRNVPGEFYGYGGHDVELTGGLVADRRVGPLGVAAELAYSQRANRLFRYCNERIEVPRNCLLPDARDGNMHLKLSASWGP